MRSSSGSSLDFYGPAYCGTCWSQSVMATEIAPIGRSLRWSRGSDPRLLRLTLDRPPDRASGERPRASKARPYLKARLAENNVFVLLCHLISAPRGSGWLAALGGVCIAAKQQSRRPENLRHENFDEP